VDASPCDDYARAGLITGAFIGYLVAGQRGRRRRSGNILPVYFVVILLAPDKRWLRIRS